MKQLSYWRLAPIVFITILTIYLVTPTARYLVALRSPTPDVPEEAAQREDRLDALRTKAIALGLDLQGGVDVRLMIDEEKSIIGTVRETVTRLNNEFQNSKISSDIPIDADSSSAFRYS